MKMIYQTQEGAANVTRCQSQLVTKDEHDHNYWPGCDLYVGHEGHHRHGHPQDVMWAWSDAEAMTPAEVTAWRTGDRGLLGWVYS